MSPAGAESAESTVRPFTIAIDEGELVELRDRIARTRWPSPAPGAAWEQGTDAAYLREMLDHWAHRFDWRATEAELNRFPQFRMDLDGVPIHFVHQRAAHGPGIPLILTHGWPSTFVELLPLVPLLTDPAAHGLTGPAFDVVIPSLPGYGFSGRPDREHTMRDTAAWWHRLMNGLGYRRYGAHGGDLGSGVSTFLALDHPEAVSGLHLSNLEFAPVLDDQSPPLSPAERAYAEAESAWEEHEGAYNLLLSTKPQTLAYGLADSPAALAAWVLEKWRAWSDCGGDLDSRFSRDFLATTLTLFWAAQDVGLSLRDYHDNRAVYDAVTPQDRVRVPTGIALFDHEFVDCGTPPREWAERLYEVRRWRRMPRGGHFAGTEEPGLLAEELGAFFGEQAG
ncbi:epoxide hydrolase family protein [Actinoalloteichus hymeniacidonis]|uniref:Hydrolase or acyltransferase of alpha/beta superfamily n=1 Tax=Actinoalloteichus hymeniacidonis TaxID=340345 RepID=A0AAC9HME7_9PSEU|nr:epoxide hydrolase family protein [Actinoalloteichus hymeniacidonis]AOS61992.1 putative hydrolase or acyltransferase of alpha/beta superfamily [Actinoalloteichus hymeniacidonis]MBB5909986.1 pimeloyl-ACP methyl ester carboxylesterase [Actinoalloteichus hymeniacidonis]